MRWGTCRIAACKRRRPSWGKAEESLAISFGCAGPANGCLESGRRVKEEIVWPSAKSSVVAHVESAEASWDVPLTRAATDVKMHILGARV